MFLKYPMWNAGISSLMYPKCPAQSISLPEGYARGAGVCGVQRAGVRGLGFGLTAQRFRGSEVQSAEFRGLGV
jgi:hypothetical protein